MKIFRVHYVYEGSGFVDIEADSREDAEDIFYGGDWDGEEQLDSNHEITGVTRETGRKC